MKASTKDRIQGKYHETRGTVREKVGAATGNPDLEASGRDERITGKLQNKIGQVEKVLEK